MRTTDGFDGKVSRLQQLSELSWFLVTEGLNDSDLGAQIQLQATTLLDQPPAEAVDDLQRAWQLSCLVAVGQHPNLAGRRPQRILINYLRDLLAKNRAVSGPSDSQTHPADHDGSDQQDRWLKLSPVEQKTISVLKQLGTKHDVVLSIQGRSNMILKEREELTRTYPGRMVRGGGCR